MVTAPDVIRRHASAMYTTRGADLPLCLPLIASFSTGPLTGHLGGVYTSSLFTSPLRALPTLRTRHVDIYGWICAISQRRPSTDVRNATQLQEDRARVIDPSATWEQ